LSKLPGRLIALTGTGNLFEEQSDDFRVILRLNFKK
jgi:hypothetical protein